MSGFVRGVGARCDLMWMNNRVRYDGRPAWNLDKRRISQGDCLIEIDENGCVHWQEERIPTGFAPNDESIALDAEHKLLYFSAQEKLIAFDLIRRKVAFAHVCKGFAGAPTLLDWLLPDGSLRKAVGLSDGAGEYAALDRLTGMELWRTQIIDAAVDAAAHWDGRLFLATKAVPFLTFCLDAQDGDLIWWNRGRGKATCGMVRDGHYEVLCHDGSVERFSLIDGERL